jgi:hypothetical protein
MNLRLTELIVLFLLISVIGPFSIRSVKASGAQVYYSVEPVAIAPLTDTNSSMNGLETPSSPSPVGQNFTVEIHLRNATITNISIGVAGVEVHFYFGNILNYCTPTGFVNMLGLSGGVLVGPAILYAIPAGFYDNADNLITAPPYTNATQYVVLGASASGPWFGIDGLVANVTFMITRQPNPLLSEPDFYTPLQITASNLVDWNGNLILFNLIQGTLCIDTAAIGPPGHDVFVTNVNPSRTVVGRGYVSSMNVTVRAGVWEYSETFNLTAYANTIPIGSQNVTLSAYTFSNVTFTWNLTGLAYGNYTMSAYAEPVPNEVSTADNNYTDGVVKITIPGDLNGDFKVNLLDLVTLAMAYASTPNDARWNPLADINGNGVIDLADLVLLATYYGQHYP